MGSWNLYFKNIFTRTFLKEIMHSFVSFTQCADWPCLRQKCTFTPHKEEFRGAAIGMTGKTTVSPRFGGDRRKSLLLQMIVFYSWSCLIKMYGGTPEDGHFLIMILIRLWGNYLGTKKYSESSDFQANISAVLERFFLDEAMAM